MKFLHTSDVHIGAKFLSLGLSGQSQRNQLKQTFERVISEMKELGIDILIVSGDLFDSPYPSEVDKSFIANLFHSLEAMNKYILILPGNHDLYIDGSVWKDSSWIENSKLYIFTPSVNTIYIEDFNAFFYANAIDKQIMQTSPLAGIRDLIVSNRDKYPRSKHLVLVHGGLDIGRVSDSYQISKNEIIDLAADYVALGDWHSLLLVNSKSTEITDYIYRLGSSPAFYSGSPEMIDFSQKGSGHIILGEYREDHIHIKVRKVGVRNVEEVTINIEGMPLKNIISEIGKNPSLDTLKIVNLTGQAEFEIDVDELKELFVDKFWKIVINLSPQYSSNIKLEEGTVAYEFAKLVQQDISNTDNEKDVQFLQSILSEGMKYLNKIRK